MEQAAVTTERKVEVSGEPVKEAESSKVGLTKDCQEGGGRQERPEGQYGHKRVWGAGPTLFIENIPRRMHWKGLWHLFARHGDVYRAYIANKLSRGGKRFGFVSFGTERDALRALERLNGFNVYGFTLTVKLANHNKWRVSGKQHGDQINKRLDGHQQPMNIQILRGISQREEHKRKVVGHVIDEDLWKLQRCLIGEMAMVCSVQSVVKRLEQWGLNGIKVQRMGGKVFLLSFEDEDLYIMLEDLQWSYLKEIFCKVDEWSVNTKRPLRATWIEVRGVPLHAWNDITLKRIAAIWGNFEAWGENAHRILNSEKTTILITTDYSRRIDETVVVEIGSETHEINILELGFKDDTVDPLTQEKFAKVPTEPQQEDSSESCSEQEQSSDSGKVSCKGDVESESFLETGARKEDVDCFEQPFGNMNSQQVWEESGNESTVKSTKVIGENDSKTAKEKAKEQETDIGLNVKSWVDVISVGIQDQSIDVGRPSKKGSQECSIENIEEGVKDVGLSANVGIGVLKDKKVVDKHHDWANLCFEAQGEVDTLYSFRELDSEFAGKKEKKNRTAKKFGSLWELQGRALSKTERKKRDRTLGCKKINKEDLQDSELSGRSLSDTDLRGKWEQAKKEARRTLELGKKFGLKIKGSEEEAISSGKMKCVSWNARGMGSNGKMMITSGMVKSQKVEVLLLQETKKTEWSAEEIRKIWSDDDFEFRMVEADGRSGRWIRLDVQVKIVNVYAPCSVAEQAKLWEEFYALKVNDSTHWLMGGDFNATRNRSESSKCSSLIAKREKFNNFIMQGHFIDLPLRGKKFTWFGPGNKRSRLDRFLIDEFWILNLRDLVQLGLKRNISDHIPILLTTKDVDWGPIPFKWLSKGGTKIHVLTLMPELVPAMFEAVKRALQTFIEADCFGGGKLTVEVGSRKVLNWIVNPLQYPWQWWKDLAEIDALIHRIKLVSFSSLNLNGSETALWLAKDGVRRLDFFRAWW
ncbi:hypothetical protein GQ457_17G025350 [Hibiscus cannabinus]